MLNKQTNTIMFVGNGSVLNRGCEAITKGTLKIIRGKISPSDIIDIDFSNEPDSPAADAHIIHHSININRWSSAWFAQNVFRVLGMDKTWFPVLGNYINNVDAVLALGGDNYSMDYGSLRTHLAVIDYVLAKNKPLIIWGGSLGPFDKRGPSYEKYVVRKLQDVNAILAREDATVNYLARLGVSENVRRVADPAFVMDPVKPRDGIIPFDLPNDAIGFNFSSLMERFGTAKDVAANKGLVQTIIQKILDQFNRPILLIPHSQKRPSDDYVFLSAVQAEFSRKGYPVHLLPRQLNAAEIKWIINNLSCFAGARMHSTIASLSSAVPTLSFSYSLKSIGLNQDIFGHEEYLLLAKDITAESVVEKIGILLQDEKAIRQHLTDQLPAIKKMAFKAGTYLQEVMQTGKLQ